jgi:hypothetical protein
MKNELLSVWKELHLKALIDDSLMNELEKDLLQKTFKELKAH